MIKYTRLYTGSDGESHFEDVEIPLNDNFIFGKKLGQTSEHLEAEEVFFWEINGVSEWHTAPRRLLFIFIDGEMTIETKDGTKRTFRRGDIMLAEDTTGNGHLSYDINRTAVVIPLA
jgi:quercetin dioxygenase-like cupin family protein